MNQYDTIIRGGTIYDGTGGEPVVGDIALKGDKIAAIGDLSDSHGKTEIDSTGLAIAPGFINMMSWANETLIEDGKSQSDIRQGVTLEVLGEGFSMGPLNEAMKRDEIAQQGDIRYDIPWTTLGEYLEHLVDRGVSPNVASFLGATTARVHVLGYDDVQPDKQQLEEMKNLVRQAMEEGAVGLSTAIIYAPSTYAKTEEFVALAKVAAEYDGIYASHIRNEGDNLLEAIVEFLTVVEQANIRGEIYHLKATGKANWHKMDLAIEKIEAARTRGLAVTADMYTYPASSTGLDTTMPPWVREGGHHAWVTRLKDPEIRKRVIKDMNTPSTEWDNGYLMVGSPENILLVGFKNEALKPLSGKTLAQIATERNTSPEETAMDLVIEDDSDVGAVFFCMTEENIHKKIRQPWMSFCSDGRSLATEGVFLKRDTHPRAYGSFARLLGKYVREEKVIPLQEAVRRLTSLPAENLKLDRRGKLTPGYFADLAIFDTDKIQDHATYAKPHQYATGMQHVFVNGAQVLKEGEHTGAKPGQVVRGPGWKGKNVGSAVQTSINPIELI